MASDFIKEKIKDRPIDKKKLAKRIGLTVLIAVVFGVVAAVTFSLVYIHLMPSSNAEQLKPVSLSSPEPEPDASLSADTSSSDIETSSESGSDSITLSADEPESPDGQTGGPAVSENQTGSDGTSVSDNQTVSGDDAGTPPVPRSTIINNITNKVDLSPESYAKLYRELHTVATDAGKALATVTVTTTDTDWFENPYESGSSQIGLIIADNGRQLLILTANDIADDAEEISVGFADGSSAEGQVMNSDADTALHIVSVNLSDISDETKDKISYANLGSSTYASTVGTPVIAIGAPLGVIGSEEYGFITSMSQEKNMSDLNVHLLTTDIYGSDSASGVIVDYTGHVMGVITGEHDLYNTGGMLVTYSISDIKDTIENLANGKERTYMGIIGTTVTQEAAESYDMPSGAYVINVDPDSPAMEAGIQSGDVITRIGTEAIVNYDDYTKVISELTAGVETVVTVQRYSRGDYTELTFEAELSKR